MTVAPLFVAPPPVLTHGSFSGHETFTFRYAWLKKGVEGLNRRPDIFTAEDAMVELGVGKNMVRSIRHWCLATKVIGEANPAGGARGIGPSSLGTALFLDPRWDEYLEDDASLWLIHWHLATNMTRATTWYWAFNVLKEQEFTKEVLHTGLKRLAEEKNWTRVADATLTSDVSCFIRTYSAGKRGPTSTAEDTLDCPLIGLGLIQEVGDTERYRFNNGAKAGLPLAIFTYALLDCWTERHQGQETLSLQEITYGEGSPGRVFRLDDTAVLAYLDDIKDLTGGRLEFTDVVMGRHVRRRGEILGREVLNAYYNP